MKTLTITDLTRTEQLDRSAMGAVRGGWNMRSTSFPKPGDFSYAPSFDSSINARQNLDQAQEVLIGTANGSAFLDGVHVDSHVSQDGKNKIVR
jgi:hypothetical protein